MLQCYILKIKFMGSAIDLGRRRAIAQGGTPGLRPLSGYKLMCRQPTADDTLQSLAQNSDDWNGEKQE